MTLDEFVVKQKLLLDKYAKSYEDGRKEYPRNFPENMTHDAWAIDMDCWADHNGEYR